MKVRMAASIKTIRDCMTVAPLAVLKPIKAHCIVVKDLALVNFRVFRQNRAICPKEIGITCVQLFARKVTAVNPALDAKYLKNVAYHLSCLRQCDATAVHSEP